MISSLASYDLRWADRPLDRKDHSSSGKPFDQSLSLNADPSTLSASQTSISDPPRPDSRVSTAIWSSVIKEPASREVEPRGISCKDDGLMMILTNDDDTQNGITTMNPKDRDGSQIVYVETDNRGTRSGYEVDVSKVDLRHCSRIEALAVASYIKDEIAARSDGTTSSGTSYSKGIISDFYHMASDGGAMFASTNNIVWDETIDFISIAERHLAHWSEPLEDASKLNISDGDAIAQCIQIADELSRIIDAQEKLPPEQRNLSYEGWDEIDVMKLGAPEPTVSSARSSRMFSASGQKLDLSGFIQRAEQRANDAWQNFFDLKDDDKR